MFGLDDAAAATLATGALGFIGGQLTNSANAARADASNQWSADQFATRYQTTVKDLEAAGLNPMLAYSQGGGSPPTAQQVQFQNPVASAMDAVRSTSGAVQSFSSAHQADAMARQADASASKILEETKNVPFQGDQIKYTVQLLAEQAALAAQQGETQVAIRRQLQATVDKMKAETGVLRLDIDARESLGNIGAQSRELKPIVDILRVLLK